MKLKTFLLISSLSVVLSGCNSIFSKHVKCDDESGLKLVEEVLREDLNKLLENELKGFIQRGEIKDLDPAKLKLSAQSVQFKLVDSRTDHIDPDSTKTTCSLDLTVNIPSDLVKKSDEARTKVGFDTVEAQALKEDIDYIAGKISKDLQYTLQPTDKGDKVIASVTDTNVIRKFISDTLLYAFLKPQIEKNQINQSSRNYSEKENAMIQSRTEAHEAEYSEGGEYYEGE
ncbi:hypothetical protein ACK2M2_13075 [Acinetobacter sp. TY1]|uniref:hypothetical protein n=1 Tax=Acinetobacter sp. TY1 TaxID=3387626 RepID=UPI003AF72D3F